MSNPPPSGRKTYFPQNDTVYNRTMNQINQVFFSQDKTLLKQLAENCFSLSQDYDNFARLNQIEVLKNYSHISREMIGHYRKQVKSYQQQLYISSSNLRQQTLAIQQSKAKISQNSEQLNNMCKQLERRTRQYVTQQLITDMTAEHEEKSKQNSIIIQQVQQEVQELMNKYNELKDVLNDQKQQIINAENEFNITNEKNQYANRKKRDQIIAELEMCNKDSLEATQKKNYSLNQNIRLKAECVLAIDNLTRTKHQYHSTLIAKQQQFANDTNVLLAHENIHTEIVTNEITTSFAHAFIEGDIDIQTQQQEQLKEKNVTVLQKQDEALINYHSKQKQLADQQKEYAELEKLVNSMEKQELRQLQNTVEHQRQQILSLERHIESILLNKTRIIKTSVGRFRTKTFAVMEQ
ncbi:Hypothetical_protein [Hexamita inflata]|uniref:Hypothetical_protein n=1 Tax=Hexamita inflata TaxID=28002 RepID=A0AA86NIB1_9EUKA|nr:Hypothetical protein HINF_LOCUS7146 [Hexamita inflata]